jgi:hypothetical protein
MVDSVLMWKSRILLYSFGDFCWAAAGDKAAFGVGKNFVVVDESVWVVISVFLAFGLEASEWCRLTNVAPILVDCNDISDGLALTNVTLWASLISGKILSSDFALLSNVLYSRTELSTKPKALVAWGETLCETVSSSRTKIS